ncbi:YlmH/Sll1252 family protein [Anaerococcus marasmi]|uniref:YlmH/Sll1252 family protein n=1 Tax=Anaerococcus marasmi TaxID=2057797 RepID=UPI003083F76F
MNFVNDKAKKSNIKKAISILERGFYTKKEVSSFFLDPFERKVIRDIARVNNIDIVFVGGNDKCERKIFVANYYYLPLEESDYIKVLSFNSSDIKHPDVLGALIHMGIDRNSIGDISILDNLVEFVVLEEEANFIKYNLSKIKREGIHIEIKEESILNKAKEDYILSTSFISSLRLDNIVSSLVNTSRSKAKNLINNRLVKVDHQTITDPSYNVDEGAMLSIRKEGRFIFDRIKGFSKKGNYHIEYRKLV